MAKGNIGNLLQHFVALRATSLFIESLPKDGWSSIEYIDPFSMGPWEQIEKSPSNKVFNEIVQTFPQKERENDLVASTFNSVWKSFCGNQNLPDIPSARMYPNTAVLLRNAFSNLKWRMKLHDINQKSQAELELWASTQDNLECTVASNWEDSQSIVGSPVPDQVPTIIMLDPYKIVADEASVHNRSGFLRESHLCYMMKSLCLNVLKRSTLPTGMPAMVLAFSYSDSDPEVPNRIIKNLFEKNNWKISRVSSGPHQVYANRCYHQGWIACSSICILEDIQAQWNQWSAI